MIAFSCSHCGATLQVKDSMAGKRGTCPSCSGTVQAPAAAAESGARASARATVCPPATAVDTAPSGPALAPPEDYPFLAGPHEADELGRLGNYRVLQVLGTGAMGVVFLAEDLYLKRRVALKAVKPSLAASADYQQRFLREARLMAAIEHEHIVRVYQVGEDRGVAFMAMQLLQGESLEQRLNRTGRLPPAEVLRVGREIAAGLAAAHARALVHRDVKPANVWLETSSGEPGATAGGRVKIIDFGLARGTGDDGRLTQAGAVIGTPAYMAPEQANGREVDARSDLFSLGALLYRACTGVLPFGGKETLAVLSALATKNPDPPHEVRPDVPRPLSELVMRLLNKDPNRRPQTAREVVEAITAIERGDADRPAAAAKPAGEVVAEVVDEILVKKQRPPARRKRKRPSPARDWGQVILVTAAVLFAVAVVLLIVAAIRHASRPRAAAAVRARGFTGLTAEGAESAEERQKRLNGRSVAPPFGGSPSLLSSVFPLRSLRPLR